MFACGKQIATVFAGNLAASSLCVAVQAMNAQCENTVPDLKEILARIETKISRIEEGLAPTGRADVVLGAQWGDEGKGKLVDALSQNYDICARVAGGSNAGHTIIVNGKK